MQDQICGSSQVLCVWRQIVYKWTIVWFFVSLSIENRRQWLVVQSWCEHFALNVLCPFVILRWWDASCDRPGNSIRVTQFFFWSSSSIRNETEDKVIQSLAGSSGVWIGLHREKEWSDGSTSLFRNWASGQPAGNLEQCASANVTDSGRWTADNCAALLNFICYRTSNNLWIVQITRPIRNNTFFFFVFKSVMFAHHCSSSTQRWKLHISVPARDQYHTAVEPGQQ